MNELTTIFVSGGFSAILCAALVFLFRNWIGERIKGAIQNEYDEKLEGHKAQLQAANNAELETLKAQLQAANDATLEKLKAQLQVAAAERNIKLTKIFERQADVIATTYGRVVMLRQLLNDVAFPQRRAVEEIQAKYDEEFDSFINYFATNRIYLPKETTAKLMDYLDWFVKMAFDFSPSSKKPYLVSLGKLFEFKKLYDENNKRLNELLLVLQDDFQVLLGIE